MLSSPSRPRSAFITPGADESAKGDDQHQHRRRFIGPLPKQLVSQDIGKHTKRRKRNATALHDLEDEDGIRDAIHNLALDFFLRHGGTTEQWGENERRGVRDELFRRWKDSEWGRAYLHSKTAKTDRRWIGTSFDVGVFLGINVLDATSTTNTPAAADASLSHRIAPSTTGETFVTAASHLSISQSQTLAGASSKQLGHDDTFSRQFTNLRDDESHSADSSTALIRPTALTSDHRPSGTLQLLNTGSVAPKTISNGTPTKGVLTTQSPASKGKGKVVHYIDTPVEDQPAPPTEVLERSGDAVENTSAGAAAEQADVDATSDTAWGDVVMRVFVKFSYTRAQALPTDFDEVHNRTTGHLYHEPWAEYIVVWRKDRLELYRSHNMPGKDWFTGHKKLVFIIPLGQSTTRLSLYSFVDLTFCIVCPPAPLRHRSRRRWLYRQRRGLNIFVFKIRSRTRAADWVWRLWRHLGGELPRSLEIHSPLLDTRIKIDMPSSLGMDVAAAYRVFNASNVISLCRERLSKLGEKNELLKGKMAAGTQLALAWRAETNLDWVWQLEDVQGNARKWAVLCGLALNQFGKSAHLEVRLQEHFPTRLHLKDGTRLDEPPAVEGYLERIRPNSQLRQSIYLTTHNGYLFTLSPARAHHPAPPGFLAPGSDAESLLQTEVQRGTEQILDAMGMMDLRGIVAVRRAFQLVPRHDSDPPSTNEADGRDTEGFWEAVERTDSDDEDIGGDAGINEAGDKSRLRMRRSFELLLTTGNVIRFEAFSCQVALEWIVRLRPLVSYWAKRHQADAQTEMNLAYISTGRARITPLRHVVDDRDSAPEALPDSETSLPELSSFFNWCVLEGCRPILKVGKIFARKGFWGQYQHIQLVLVRSNLIQYLITGSKSLHHHQYRVINLLDAYVCSGYLAAQYLPEGQYDPDAPHVARRYQDGLETDDGAEDTLFMLWYRTTKSTKYALGDDDPVVSAQVPKLTLKRKVMVFRTRNKLERDAWVWAINVEIEKAVRSRREREESIREAGTIMNV